MDEDYASGGIIRKVTVAIEDGGCVMPTPNTVPLYVIKTGKNRKRARVMQSGLVKVLAPRADLSGHVEILVDLACFPILPK